MAVPADAWSLGDSAAEWPRSTALSRPSSHASLDRSERRPGRRIGQARPTNRHRPQRPGRRPPAGPARPRSLTARHERPRSHDIPAAITESAATADPPTLVSCLRQSKVRVAKATLTWGYGWWQVLGSNQRRLSRRFYRPLPLATRATCRTPPDHDGTVKDSGTARARHLRWPTATPWFESSACPAHPGRLTWDPWLQNPRSTSCRRSIARKSTTR